jgi:hypothetical protein
MLTLTFPVASTVTTSTFTSNNIVEEASATEVITDTLPALTVCLSLGNLRFSC